MKIEEILSRNLSALMAQNGDLGSQQKLGQKSGVGQTTVGRMRRAEGSATIDNVQAVAKAFGFTASDLLDPNLHVRLALSPQLASRTERITACIRAGQINERQLKVIEATLELE